MKIVKNTANDNTQTTQSPYSVTESGVYHADTWLCSPLHLIGTGTDNGGNYYRVAEFSDRFTGKIRRIAISAAEIGSNAILSKLQGVVSLSPQIAGIARI